MNCAKKSKGRCVYCPEAEVFPQVTDPKKKLVTCKMKPEMKIDRFTRQPDWCPLKTEMQTLIALPNIPDDQGVNFVYETT